MEIIGNFLPTGILFITTIAFGFWVSRRGRPYNNLLFNIHKLLALAGVILTGVRFFRLDPINTFPARIVAMVGIAVTSVIILFASGAIMSIKEEESKPVLFFHQAAPVIVAVTLIAVLFLLR